MDCMAITILLLFVGDCYGRKGGGNQNKYKYASGSSEKYSPKESENERAEKFNSRIDESGTVEESHTITTEVSSYATKLEKRRDTSEESNSSKSDDKNFFDTTTSSEESYDDSSSDDDRYKLHNQPKQRKRPELPKPDADTVNRYLSEVKNGDTADLMGTNPHVFQLKMYSDLSRRFVPQHPYVEVKDQPKGNANEIVPEKASPEVVFDLAQRSAILNALEPTKQDDESTRKNILRSGNYWNAVWMEDDPKVLRSYKKKPGSPMKLKISTADKYYELISLLKKISPRLLYIVNKKRNNS